MKQAHVFISGTVQGVGYRQFVKSNARKMSLTGWVRNTEDGGVEAIFQGKEDVIELIVEICRKGPFLSEVKHVGFEWEETDTVYESFAIK